MNRTATGMGALLAAWVVSAAAAMAADEGTTPAAETPAPQQERAIGYVDADRDGVNDRFRDADGDGRNDVDGKAYAHRFRTVDSDGDGVNDLFADADGDGVNDLSAQMVDVDQDGVCDNVVDADGDDINDITAEPYDGELGGWRRGRIAEESARVAAEFVDEDGDGLHDPWAAGGASGRMDLFIDEDGDGIADGRAVRGRHGQTVDHPLLRQSTRGQGQQGNAGRAPAASGEEERRQNRHGGGRSR